VKRIIIAGLANLMLIASATPAAAQHPKTREGFWFNGGLGYGCLGWHDCERDGGLSGGLSLGGTVSPHFLIGVGTTGWTKSESNVTLTAGTLDARVRYYPSVKGGFFLTGGLGLGAVAQSLGSFSVNEIGVGLVLGLGFDVRVGKNVSLTPFWNGFAVVTANGDANIGQIGLSITAH
jgi:hypothetical protein